MFRPSLGEVEGAYSGTARVLLVHVLRKGSQVSRAVVLDVGLPATIPYYGNTPDVHRRYVVINDFSVEVSH